MNLFDLSLNLTSHGDAEMKHALNSVGEGAEWLKGKFEMLLTVLAGGTLFNETINKSVELAEHLEILGLKTGETVQQLSRLEFAAKMSEVEASTLGIGLKKLAMSMQGVNLDTGNAVKAFDAMGLKATDANGKLRTTTDVLLDVADKFSTYKDGAAKAALAMDIFGRSGVDLIPMLNKGREGIKELTDEADKLGVTMDENSQRKLRAYEESMKKVHAVADVLGRSIAVGLVPALGRLADDLTEAGTRGDHFASITEGITKAIAFLSNAIIQIKIALQGFWDLITIVWTFLTEGFGAAKEKLGQLADEMIDSQDAAGQAVLRNRMIMHGWTFDIDKATESQDKLNKKVKEAPMLSKAAGEDNSLKKRMEEWKNYIEFQKSQLEYELELSRDNYQKKHVLLKAALDDAAATYGEQSKEYVDLMKRLAELDRERSEQFKRDKAKDLAEMLKELEPYARYVEQMAQAMSDAVTGAIEAPFQALFAGKGIMGAMRAFGAALLKGLGSIFTQMGEQYLAYGAIMSALAELLPDPFTAGPAALAIGVALIGLGAALGSIGGGGGSGAASRTVVSSGSPVGYSTPGVFVNGGGVTAANALAPATAPVYISLIGKDDPRAQTELLQMIDKAQRRGG